MIARLNALLRKWLGSPSLDGRDGRQGHISSPADLVVDHGADSSGNFIDHSTSHLVAYDENLLERSRTQWQFGDWASLAQLSRDALQHHPDRAKLALLAAAGHQALGNAGEARHLSKLALDWGCSKKLVSQILIGGVHNTLGRAAAIGGAQQRALKHFERAVSTVNPGIEHRLIARARAREELERMALSSNVTIGEHAALMPAGAPPLQKEITQTLAEQLRQQNAALAQQISQQNDHWASLSKTLESTVKKEMLNATQQLEAYLGIQNYLNQGERLPNMHGWPVSPDFALYLIELIDRNNYDLIIEFGSGTSTVLMAKALARNASSRQEKPATVQVAFEHLEQFYAQSRDQLQQAGLAQAVQLILAPLQPYTAPNGHTYSYYSCPGTLEELSRQMQVPAASLRILLLVDGPPAAVGKHARYPALPAVLAHFSGAHIDILLDDYIREDEKEIARLWLKDLAAAGISSSMTTKKMEKDACLISTKS